VDSLFTNGGGYTKTNQSQKNKNIIMTEILRKISKSSIRNILAVIIVLGCFVLMYLMIIKPVPAENKDTINIVAGFVFGGALAGVCGYYFGSSKAEGDRAKKEVTDENN
jgi:hypothetical protein